MKNTGRMLGFVIFVLVSITARARGQGWVATGSMTYSRVEHTATRLNDGRVLVAGGTTTPDWAAAPTAEVYEPATAIWTLTGSMNYARGGGHSATLLTNGKVLVAGRGTAELYDPGTGIWTLTGSMNYSRMYHSATLLSDGRVLVAGGTTAPDWAAAPTAELYDPGTGIWTLTGSMNHPRGSHTATLLNDGKVLVAGGDSGGTVEYYDATIGTWTLTGSMNYARWGHIAALLTDGRVLVGGGTTSPGSCADPPFCFASVPSATAEVYDRVTGVWRVTGPMTDPRINHAAVLLANGRVLVAGGEVGCSVGGDAGEWPTPQLDSAEEYDPLTDTWAARTHTQTGRYLHTATLLNDGGVLVAGGISETITTVSIADDGEYIRQCELGQPTAGSEIYHPASPATDPEPPETSIVSAVDGKGASVPDGGITLWNAITFTFSGTDNVAVAGFECQLDSVGFMRCPNPLTYSGLALGRHVFEVRAVDTSNNRDATPAPYTWTVDSPPETTITSAVDRQGRQIPNGGTTSSNVITFNFTGTDNVRVAGFDCSLDGAAFIPCVSPVIGGVKLGAHTFQVRAIDNNAFRDATPASFSWTRR